MNARAPTALHHAEWAGAMLALQTFRALDIDRASALGGALARAVGPKVGRIDARMDRRIAAALPELGTVARAAVRRAAWDNLGRTIAEFAHYDRLRAAFAEGRAVVGGADVLADLKRAGRPAIFVSAHVANWEVMQLSLIEAGLKGVTVYRAANNPLVDRMIAARRRAHGGWDLAPKGRDGAKRLIAALREGLSICLLADQKMNDGAPSPFFGHPAMTTTAPAELSLKFGAPIVPGAITREGGAQFRVIVGEPWEPAPSGDRAGDVAALTARINAHLEAVVRARPGEWLWQHNRWPRAFEDAAAGA